MHYDTKAEQLEGLASVEMLEFNDESVSIEGILDFLPKFTARLNQARQDFDRTVVQHTGHSDLYKLSNQLGNRDYMSLRNLRLPCPRGLKVSYLAYAKVLLESARHCQLSYRDVLNPVNTWLGLAMSNPSYHDALVSSLKTFGPIEKANKQLITQIAGCMVSELQIQVSERDYGELLLRNQDWRDLAVVIDTLQKELSTETQRQFVELHEIAIQRSKAATDALLESYRAGKVSRTVVQDAAKAMQLAAQEFEFYALVRQLTTELDVALKAAIDVVKRSL